MSADERAGFAVKILGIVVLGAIVVVGLVRFVEAIPTVATILLGAVFVFYIVYPAVRRLNARLPLWAAIAIVYVVFLSLIALGVAVLVPALSQNIRQLVRDAPSLVRGAQAVFTDPHNPLVAHLPPSVRAELVRAPEQAAQLLQRYGAQAASRLLGVLLSFFSIAALLIIIPVVALYILLESERIRAAAVGVIPPAARPRVFGVISKCNAVVGGFVRGQIMVAAIVGLLVVVLLSILHVKYALLIGVVAGVLEVIPYVGGIVGAVPAIVIALFTNGAENALFVALGFVVINQIEGHLIAPFVVSESVGLSPLLVILALLTGGELFGLPGLVIGVPLAGVINVVLGEVVPHYPPVDLDPVFPVRTRAKPPRGRPRGRQTR